MEHRRRHKTVAAESGGRVVKNLEKTISKGVAGVRIQVIVKSPPNPWVQSRPILDNPSPVPLDGTQL